LQAGLLDIPLTGGDHLTQALHGSPLASFINTVQHEASGARISACALPNEFKGLPMTVTVRDVADAIIEYIAKHPRSGSIHTGTAKSSVNIGNVRAAALKPAQGRRPCTLQGTSPLDPISASRLREAD